MRRRKRVLAAIGFAVVLFGAPLVVNAVTTATTATVATCTASPTITPGVSSDSFRVTCSYPKPAASTSTVTVTAPVQTVTVTTSPTPTATTTATVAPAAFPNAATTGVPAGTVLANSGDVTVTVAGTVVDALDVAGSITVNASNVTIKRTRVTGSAYALIRVADTVTGVTISDVEINGKGLAGLGNSGGVIGPAAVLRANIYGVENGLVPGSGSSLRDNWVHNLNAPGSPHIDGIQIDGGGANIDIQHNTIDVSEWGQTSAVMTDNYYGALSNVTVNNNRLLGGGYTVYCDAHFNTSAMTAIAFTNNRLGKGFYGYNAFTGCTPTWTNNVDDVTGAQVAP